MRFNRLLIVSSLCAMLAVPALAAEPRPPFDPVVQITKLHDTIGITAAEESVWAPVADILLANAKANHDRFHQWKDKAGSKDKVSAVDRLKKEQILASARVDELAKLGPAVEKLYAALTPAQQALADAAFAPHRHPWHKMDHKPSDMKPAPAQ